MDCYNRCLCITCANNETCPDGCEMCQKTQVCRFILTRGKCRGYVADKVVIQAMAIEQAQKGGADK